MALTKGSKAPDFSLPDQDNKVHTLKDYKGKKVILYFYPKDNTPGCTKEACSFRDDHAQWKKKGAIILGISPDNAKSHKKFANTFSLPFPLLADTEKKMANAYGVYGEKKLYGIKYMGIFRTTFVIDEKGIIADIITKVNCETHSKDLLQTVYIPASKSETIKKLSHP